MWSPQTTAQLDWWRHPPAEAPAGAVEAADGNPRRDRVAFGALVVFTVILIGAPQEHVRVLATLRIAFLAAVVAIAAHLLGGGLQVHRRIPIGVALAGSLFILAVVSITYSLWPGGSFATLTDRYLKSLVIFWLLGRVVSTVGRLERIAWTLALVNIPIMLTALAHFAAGDFASGRLVGYASGLAANPNDLALTLALPIPLTVALALACERGAVRLIAWVLVVLSTAAIVATFSRGGLLTLGIEAALLAGLMLRHRAGPLLAGFAVAALIGLLLLPSGYGARVATIVDISADPTSSAQNRWRDTVAAARYVAAHPLSGAGLGQDILALNKIRGAKWLSVHNSYLNYGVDLGLPGLVLFAAFVIASYVSARRVERRAAREGRERLSLLAAGVRISMAGLIVAGFFYPIAYHVTFYYFGGLAVALGTIDDSTA
jgi:O-antigen ligase